MSNTDYNKSDILTRKENILKDLEQNLLSMNLIEAKLNFSRDELLDLQFRLEDFFIEENKKCLKFLDDHFIHFLFYIGDIFISSVNNAEWIVVVTEVFNGPTYYEPVIQINKMYIDRMHRISHAGALDDGIRGLEVDLGELPSLEYSLQVLDLKYERISPED